MARTHFPTGQLTDGGSVLVQADNVSIKFGNAVQLKGTLADPNGSPVAGMRSIEISWKMRVDQNGPELSMLRAVSEAAPMPLGWTFPGGFSLDTTVTASDATIAQSLGEVCEVDCVAKGRLDASNGF